MKRAKKWAALLLSVLLAGVCAGCGVLPSEDFDDYDVSSYIQALLDSSYHNSHENFVAITQATQESAQANNTTTVENAAINFCNTYSISPNEEQLKKLQEIMRQALLSAKYTVKEEQKIETGYSIEVEVSPITSFAGMEQELAQLRTQAQEEAAQANIGALAGDSDQAGEDDSGTEGETGEEGEPTPTPVPSAKVDSQTLFIDKVLESCQAKASAVEFQGQNVSIVLDIRLTGNGELQLDLNQIDDIDQTVLLFQKQ